MGKGNTEKPHPMTAAVMGLIMTYNFIGYHKTMVFQTEPLAALWATNRVSPIYYPGYKTYTH
jgi:hypothetical protein